MKRAWTDTVKPTKQTTEHWFVIVMTVDTITVKGGAGVPSEVIHTIVTVKKASRETMLVEIVTCKKIKWNVFFFNF